MMFQHAETTRTKNSTKKANRGLQYSHRDKMCEHLDFTLVVWLGLQGMTGVRASGFCAAFAMWRERTAAFVFDPY
eukprot:570922-Prorocentrum_minimum.AAC.2